MHHEIWYGCYQGSFFAQKNMLLILFYGLLSLWHCFIPASNKNLPNIR